MADAGHGPSERAVASIPDSRSARSLSESGLPPMTGALRPLVDLVAAIKVSVHVKLLAGFLVGALLLLGMALLSLLVISRMSERVGVLTRLHEKVDHSRQMEYAITAQSHFRAMALLTNDDSNNIKIADSKQAFLDHLDAVERLSSPDQSNFFGRVRQMDAQFSASSDRVLALHRADNNDAALQLHLAEEHPVSHLLEAAMRELQADAVREMTDARMQFETDRGLLTTMVATFSVVSLASALLLGFVLSWSLIRPVRKIDHMLAGIAEGHFAERVEVPNRDEFGTLSRNLNVTSMRLESLYNQLHALNTNLQQKVEEQLGQLERASTLRRYLSPQLADSILAGSMDVNLASRRKNLTVFFSDIRGFTTLAERMEPEELVDHLNQYLTAMTEIVFKHGGTLDKYIGDAIMVFFGDPIPHQDHAARAVRMALEMRAKLAELQRQWSVDQVENLTIGMGISTGYVTVGNIGSAARLEYTVLGNHVNLASRLADRAEAGQILVGERTLLAVRDLVEAREIDQVELEGVSRPIKIYEISEKDSLEIGGAGPYDALPVHYPAGR